MTASKKLLSVVVPCYDEQGVVALFYAHLKTALVMIPDCRHEIIFVDDGSVDGTLRELNSLADSDPTVTVLALSRNFGHQAALAAGLDHAKGDVVVTIDADLQHPPSLIPELANHCLHEGYDVVSAVRTDTAGASWFKKASSRAFYALINGLSDTRVEPSVSDFCALSRRACDTLRAMPERHRFMRGLTSWIGFNRRLVHYEAGPRIAGSSKYTLRKMRALALDGVFAFSVAPIRLGILVGLATSAAGAIYLVYVMAYATLHGGLVRGWGSLISVVLIMGGLQITLIGIVGEYVGRIFEQVKGRPLYVLKQAPTEAHPANPRRARDSHEGDEA